VSKDLAQRSLRMTEEVSIAKKFSNSQDDKPLVQLYKWDVT